MNIRYVSIHHRASFVVIFSRTYSLGKKPTLNEIQMLRNKNLVILSDLLYRLFGLSTSPYCRLLFQLQSSDILAGAVVGYFLWVRNQKALWRQLLCMATVEFGLVYKSRRKTL